MSILKKTTLIIILLLLLTFAYFYIHPISQYNHIPSNQSQCVIVAGAEPEGIAAAVAAARSGCKVYLLDQNDVPGGLFTSGMMSALDINYKTRLPLFILNKGFFKEFYDSTSNGYNFDVQKAQVFFIDAIQNNNITYIPSIDNWKPIMEGNKITGISYEKDNKWNNIESNVVIDSSLDAQIARKAGVPYRLGREELGLEHSFAASTLVFSVNNVDWNAVKKYLRTDEHSGTNALKNAAWGYPQMYDYPSVSPDIQMRGLNLSKQNDGSVIINALLIFNINPLDATSVEQGKQKAIDELPSIVSYMRKHLVGFENAELGKYADTIYIREGVRIVGEETLTGEDVFEHTNFWNKIGFGSYPIDLQSSYKGGYGNNLYGRSVYSIPFGVIIPKNVEQLLVASRSSSFDIISHGSARTVPVLMGLGQSAGIAAKYSIENNISFREMNKSKEHMKILQKQLKKQQIDFWVYLPSQKDINHWAYPYLKELRKHAFVSAGMGNDFKLNNKATPRAILNTFSLVAQHSKLKFPYVPANQLSSLLQEKDYIYVTNRVLQTNYTTLKEIYNASIIDDVVYEKLTSSNTYTNAHTYAFMSQLVQFLAKTQNIDLHADPIHTDVVDAIIQ